jgi:hypothetical protein
VCRVLSVESQRGGAPRLEYKWLTASLSPSPLLFPTGGGGGGPAAAAGGGGGGGGGAAAAAAPEPEPEEEEEAMDFDLFD